MSQGHFDSISNKDPSDENAFFIYEAYRDGRAFAEHKKNPPYQKWELQILPEMVTEFQPLLDVDAVCSLADTPAQTLQRSSLKTDADYLAPDGSEIRLLPTMNGGGLAHCRLPNGKTSSPVAHYYVEEIWYVLEGQGDVWRKTARTEEVVQVSAGTSLTIPPRTAFQFRNTGSDPLCILIVTMPSWPGPQEAERVDGIWPATA